MKDDMAYDKLVDMSLDYIVSWFDLLLRTSESSSVFGADNHDIDDELKNRMKRMKRTVLPNVSMPIGDSKDFLKTYLDESMAHGMSVRLSNVKKIYELKTDDLNRLIESGHSTFNDILNSLNLDFWLTSTLLKLAKLIYSSSATSAETERIFSTSKYIDDSLRQSLSDTKMEFQLVLARFLHWLSENKKFDDFFGKVGILIRTPSDLNRVIHYSY